MAKKKTTKKQSRIETRAKKTSLLERIRTVAGNRRLLMVVVLYILVCALFLIRSFGGLVYREGDIAGSDIVSPHTIDFIDEEATAAARDKAGQDVGAVYALTPGFRTGIERVFRNLLDALKADPADKDMSRVEGLLYDFGLGADTVKALLNLDTEKALHLWMTTSTVLNRLREPETVDEQSLIRIGEDVARYAADEELDPALIPIIEDIVSVAVKTNLEVDVGATEEMRRSAEDTVEPVARKIRKNEVIVRKGDAITKKHLEIIKSLGLLASGAPWALLAGNALLVALAFFVIGVFMKSYASSIYRDEKKLLMFFVLVLLAALWAVLVDRVPIFSGYMIGVASGAITILMCLMLSPMMALVTVPVFATVTVIVMELKLGHFLVALVAVLAAYFYSVRRQDKDSMIRAGIAISVGNMIAILIMTLIKFNTVPDALLDIFVFGGLNGLLAFVLATGLMPVFERLFNVTTPHRLLELSNPEEPLLKRLLIEAPGSYHHSILVGNLAETAAEAVGANALLARIACYYHDIGKLKRPYFFVENRMDGTSQLTDIAPTLGALVISSHVKDGVEMARENGLPEEILRMIGEHHGTCLISFFYQQAKAKAEAGECEEVDEDRFRYPGPKPQRMESAIIMLADSCEAAVRSMKSPTPKGIENTVENIVESRLREGQFDHCDITLKQIDTIKNSLIKTLAGIYHSRMEYPDLEELKQREIAAKKNGDR